MSGRDIWDLLTSSFFYPEDGEGRFCQNVVNYLSNYIGSHPKGCYSSAKYVSCTLIFVYLERSVNDNPIEHILT